jgi:hypothetical protein
VEVKWLRVFENGETAAQAFLDLSRAGKTAEIFSDAVLLAAMRRIGETNGGEQRGVSLKNKLKGRDKARNGEGSICGVRGGEMEFSSLTYSRKRAIVIYRDGGGIRKGRGRTDDPELGDVKGKTIRGW